MTICFILLPNLSIHSYYFHFVSSRHPDHHQEQREEKNKEIILYSRSHQPAPVCWPLHTNKRDPATRPTLLLHNTRQADPTNNSRPASNTRKTKTETPRRFGCSIRSVALTSVQRIEKSGARKLGDASA
jgi:hypothetical protein